MSAWLGVVDVVRKKLVAHGIAISNLANKAMNDKWEATVIVAELIKTIEAKEKAGTTLSSAGTNKISQNGNTTQCAFYDPANTDLTKDNKTAWKKHEKFCRQKYKGNKQQLEIALSLKQVKNRLTACIGQPGKGKTEVLADAVNAITILGHTALVCAVSNKAVDKAANSYWEDFPEAERSKYKFLRYEIGAAKLHSIMARPDFEDPRGGDPIARPKCQAPTTIDDDDDVFMQLCVKRMSMIKRSKRCSMFQTFFSVSLE